MTPSPARKPRTHFGLIAAFAAVLVGIVAIVFSVLAEDAPRSVFIGGMVIAMGGVAVLSTKWTSTYARASQVTQVHFMATDGGVLVVEDCHTEVGGGYATIDRSLDDEYRVTSLRLSDGTRAGHITAEDEVGLRVLGAAPEFVWCTSRRMPLHTRHPTTLEVILDHQAVVGSSGVVLKQNSDRDNPVFDAASRGVHVFCREGRGYLITPDLKVVETPRADLKPYKPEHVVHGDSLVFTQVIDAEPGVLPPRLGFHPSPKDPKHVVQLSMPGAHGKPAWSSEFRRNTLLRATALGLSRDRVVFVLGPSQSRTKVIDGRSVSFFEPDDDSHNAALGLDAATGAVAWQIKL